MVRDLLCSCSSRVREAGQKGKLFGLCSKEGKGQRSIDDFRDQRAYHSENGQNQWVAGKVGGVLWSFLEPEYAWFISKSLQLQFCATRHTVTYLTASICATESCIPLPPVGKAWSSGSALHTEDISLALRTPLASLLPCCRPSFQVLGPGSHTVPSRSPRSPSDSELVAC